MDPTTLLIVEMFAIVTAIVLFVLYLGRAQLLSQERINNIIDLKQKIRTEEDIKEYSEKLGIRKRLVEEWVRLGEFSRLHGINQNYITLLEKIGVRTVEDLSKENPNKLYKKMTQIEDIRAIPSIGMIKYWIRNAGKKHETTITLTSP